MLTANQTTGQDTWSTFLPTISYRLQTLLRKRFRTWISLEKSEPVSIYTDSTALQPFGAWPLLQSKQLLLDPNLTVLRPVKCPLPREAYGR